MKEDFVGEAEGEERRGGSGLSVILFSRCSWFCFPVYGPHHHHLLTTVTRRNEMKDLMLGTISRMRSRVSCSDHHCRLGYVVNNLF